MGKAEKSQYTGNVQVCVGVGECRPEFMAKSTKYYYFVVSLYFSLLDLLLFKHLKLKVKICHFLGTGSSGKKRFCSCALCLPYFWQRGTGAVHANLCVLAPR